MGVLHQPHWKSRLKRVSRLVVLPDYQGIGLGYKFLKVIADYYKVQGYDFGIVTSAKNFVMKLYHSSEWTMTRLGKNDNNKSPETSKIDAGRKSMRTKCITASFKYRG